MEYRYTLDIRVPGKNPERVEVKDKLSIGQSPGVNKVYQEVELAPKHCVFRIQNNVLSIHNLASDYKSTIDGVPLTHGKMYIIDKGDKITLGQIEILIRKDKISGNTRTDLIPQGMDDLKGIFSSDKTLPELSLNKSPKESQGRTKPEIPSVSKPSETDFDFDSDSLDKSAKKKPQLKVSKQKKKTTTSNIPPKHRLLKIEKKDFWDSSRIPGMPARIFSLVAMLSLTIFLQPFIAQLLNLSALGSVLISFIPFKHALIEPSLLFYLNFTLLNIISHLVLGSNIPLFFMGAHETSGYTLGRVRAFLCSIIGAVTLPLLIFELPIIIGKRTLKEVLTGSKFSYRGSAAKYLGGVIILPLLICLPLISPFLSNKSFEKISTNEVKLEKREVSNDSSKILNIHSKFFGFSIANALPERFFVFPNFNPIRKGIIFTDAKKRVEMAFFPLKTIKLSKLDRILSKNYDPFFKTLHKNIIGIKRRKLENLMINNEVLEVIYDALILCPYNSHIMAIKHGPLFDTLFGIRKDFLRLIKVSDSYRVDRIRTPKIDYLSISSNKKNYLIMLQKGILTQFEIQTENKQIVDSFYKLILSSSKAYKKNMVTQEVKLNAFSILEVIKPQNIAAIDDSLIARLDDYMDTFSIDSYRESYQKNLTNLLVSLKANLKEAIQSSFSSDAKLPMLLSLFDSNESEDTQRDITEQGQKE